MRIGIGLSLCVAVFAAVSGCGPMNGGGERYFGGVYAVKFTVIEDTCFGDVGSNETSPIRFLQHFDESGALTQDFTAQWSDSRGWQYFFSGTVREDSGDTYWVSAQDPNIFAKWLYAEGSFSDKDHDGKIDSLDGVYGYIYNSSFCVDANGDPAHVAVSMAGKRIRDH